MLKLDRIRFATRVVGNPYEAGLRLVPVGLWLLAAAGNDAGWWPRQDLHFLALPLVALAVWLVHRHYRRTYGTVVADESCCDAADDRIPMGVFTVALVVAGAAEIAYSPDPSILGLVLVAFVTTLLFLRGERPYRTHYATVATVVLVALLLSPLAFDVPEDEAIFDPGGFLWNLYVGIVLTAGGIADHLLVARTLRPVPGAAGTAEPEP